MRKTMTLIISALLAFAFVSSATAGNYKPGKKKYYPKAVEMPVNQDQQVAVFKKKGWKKGSIAA